jgi:hypothetical protein
MLPSPPMIRTVSENEQISSQLREVRRFCTVKYPRIFTIPVIGVKDLEKKQGMRREHDSLVEEKI